MKRLLFFTGAMIVLLYILLFPSEAFRASSYGITLWFQTILPTLLPFVILSDLLISSGVLHSFLLVLEPFFKKGLGLSGYGGYALFLGLLCGYPMGAKITADLYRQSRITKREADYLLTFVNNASPAFLQGYVLIHILHMEEHRILIFSVFYTSVLITSLITRFILFQGSTLCEHHDIQAAGIPSPTRPIAPSVRSSLGRLVDYSIMNGLETMARLGGYLVLFSILSSMICRIGRPFSSITPYLASIMEITTGLPLLRNVVNSDHGLCLLVLTFASFGGISTLAQTKGMLHGTPLSIHTYVIGKLVHTCCTFLLGLVFFSL